MHTRNTKNPKRPASEIDPDPEKDQDKRQKMGVSDEADNSVQEMLKALSQQMAVINRNTATTNAKLDIVANDIANINQRVDGVEEKIQKMDNDIDKRIDEKIKMAMAQNPQSTTKSNASPKSDKIDKESAYWTARKTLLLGPTDEQGNDDDATKAARHITKILQIQRGDFESHQLQQVRIVIRRRKINGEWKSVKMYRVTFQSRFDRDRVMFTIGNAYNRGFRIEYEVPDFLVPLQRRLERYAYQMRKDQSVKTTIRFNDDKMDLILLTKSEGQSWSRTNVPDDQ